MYQDHARIHLPGITRRIHVVCTGGHGIQQENGHHVQGNTAIQVHPWKKCQTNPVQNGEK